MFVNNFFSYKAFLCTHNLVFFLEKERKDIIEHNINSIQCVFDDENINII